MRAVTQWWWVSALVVMTCCAAPAVGQLQYQGLIREFGSGCGARSDATWELFDPATFDLAQTLPGQGLEWSLNAQLGYDVRRGGGLLPVAPGSVDTMSRGVGVSGPWALGFSFSYTGGRSTSSVDVFSAGYVSLVPGSSTSGRCCDGGLLLREFLRAEPSFAVYGQSLNPSPSTGAGTLWFSSATLGGQRVSYFTWENVAEGVDPLAQTTCQIQFWDDHRCVMAWGAVADSGASTLVGWSGGLGVPDLGSVDLSVLPRSGSGPPSAFPLRLESSVPFGAPGTVFNFLLANRDASQAFPAALLIGTGSIDHPLDAIGMTGCSLLSDATLGSVPGVVVLSDVIFRWATPFDQSLVGRQFVVQAAAVDPSANALGVIVSNGLEMQLSSFIRPVPLGSYIHVIATGASSRVADPAQPFWEVRHADPSRPGIRRVVLDFGAATWGGGQDQFFDTEFAGLSIASGNSTLAGCAGTFRNGTEQTTGLVFAGTPASPCDPAASQGFVRSGAITPVGVAPGAYRRLEFSFSQFDPGESFEFDCATIGGASATPYGLIGMMISVELVDGTTLSGPLVSILSPTLATQTW